MPNLINMVGEKFGRMTVVADRDDAGNLLGDTYIRRVEAICECGKRKLVNARSLRQGKINSCGCLHRTHGLSKHPLGAVWRSMISRCGSETSHDYQFYGARGIDVCAEWRDSVSSFVLWAKSAGWEKGMHLDRIKNNEGYSPSNCRFVTHKENQNNRRSNTIISVRGEDLTLSQAAEKYRIPYARLNQRISKLGWQPERAIKSE